MEWDVHVNIVIVEYQVNMSRLNKYGQPINSKRFIKETLHQKWTSETIPLSKVFIEQNCVFLVLHNRLHSPNVIIQVVPSLAFRYRETHFSWHRCSAIWQHHTRLPVLREWQTYKKKKKKDYCVIIITNVIIYHLSRVQRQYTIS